MRLTSYRAVLRIPGMRMLMLVGLIGRIPTSAATTALTLSVVLDLHRGYGAAGLVSASFTVGVTLGAPLLGQAVDRRNPRPVLMVTGVAALAFWLSAPLLPFEVLIPAAMLGGLLQVPVGSLVRQSLAARTPEGQRRQAYSLDSMIVEVSYMVGPALAVLMITQLGDGASTVRAEGCALAFAACGLYAYNPRVTTRPESISDADAPTSVMLPSDPVGPARPNWLAPGFLLVLGVTTAAFLVVGGTEVSIVATLRANGQTQWIGVALIAWSVASVVGGFVIGAMSRPLTMLTLMALLGVCTIPVGLAHNWWLLSLALIPAGLACAPTIAATADAVSRAVPESVRGEAIGRHSAALTLGSAIGAPLAGVVIDHSSPAFGFVAVGAIGAALALAAMSANILRKNREPAYDAA